ncbi:hypothetical protein TTHT_1916 [Thermotomaculum hydrothermale]|uniref:Organic solvent tolerance-like N-terminal domain-containing protein n=1 Tax=Thermotomaculum hydrothermale TaxID=981385 RepID=A0A7R6PIS0_9BACT|nr:LptA/OstA family protein [Thermotomaculum hydrothermale]BBB33369.1 hypothetical protein TTHT_1916 [Thermotomaculum hydrothermale]
MLNSFTKRKKIFKLALILFLSVFTAKADQFTVKADKIKTDTKNKIVYLYGNCLIKGKSIRLKADKIKIDKNKGVIIASGNVEFDKNQVKGTGKKLVYYTDSEQATIFKGELILESDYAFYAEEITYLSGDKYRLKNCTFTTCPKGCDYWGFHANKVNVKKEGYASFKSLKFQIKKKSVFYLPFFIYPAKTQRAFGLLVPEFGNSSKHGFNYRQELFIPIGQSQDITLGIDYYSKAGTGTTFEYRESFRKGEFAKFKIYSIKDRIIDQRRTMGELNYTYTKSPENTYQFKAFLGDDYNLITDYTFNRYDLAMRDFYGYGSFYKKLSEHFTISASAYLDKPIFNDQIIYSSTLPSISIYGENFKFWGRDLRLIGDISILSDDRISNNTFSREYFKFESSKYFNKGFFIIKENLSLKTLNYSDSDLNNNSVFDFSYTFQLPYLSKDYSNFRNDIIPFVKIGYRDNSGKFNILYHDLEDYINPSGVYLKAGVTSNFIFSDRTGFFSIYGEKNLNSNNYIDPNDPQKKSEFSSINGYLSIPVTKNLIFSSLIRYNPKTNNVDTLTLNTKFNNLYLTYLKGYIYGEDKTRNSLIGRYDRELSRNWKAIVQFDYDFSLDDFRYKRITFAYFRKCIGVNVTYQNNSYSTTTTNQFTVSLVLRSIGELFKYRLGL